MLTLPSVHPFLLAIEGEQLLEEDRSTSVPYDAWQTIVEEATAQRLAPLLLRRLTQSAHHQIPAHVLAVLKQEVVRHTAWNLLLAKELKTILAACEQQGIACIPIRGPVLAEQLYGDDSMRQMDDLDVLVHREELPAVKNLFRQLGYVQHEQRPGFSETFSYSLEFIHPQHGLVVEPHWTLAYPPFSATADMQPVWARARRARWMEMDTWALSEEDLLLHLCLHLHHKGQHVPLLWFHELATLINRHGSTLNWDIVMKQAWLMEQSDRVADVLTVVRRELYSTIPNSVITQLREPPLAICSPSAIRHHLLARSFLSGREEFSLLCSLQSVRQQLRYLSALFFPSPQYMTRRYGVSTRISLIGFYIARFFHLGAEGVRCVVAWIGDIIAARPRSYIRK